MDVISSCSRWRASVSWLLPVVCIALVGACSSANGDAMPSGGDAGSGGAAGSGAAGKPGGGAPNEAGAAGNPVTTGGQAGATTAGGNAGAGGNNGGATSQPTCKLPDGLPLTTPTAIAVPSSEDFTFDREGNLVGVGMLGGLSHATYDGKAKVVLPKFIEQGPVRGVRYLQNGDLLVVDGGSGALVRVTPGGGVSTAVSGLDQPNGIAMGSNGHAFISVHDGAIEYNPDDGKSGFAVKGGGGYYDGIGLSLGDSTLYLVDALTGIVKHSDLSVAEGSRSLLDLVDITKVAPMGSMVFLDGMTLDECGNAYVVQMSGSVWQVPREGEPKQILALEAGILCAVNFGSGVGGWKADALYVMTLSSTGVYEIPLGFKGKKDPYLEP